MKAVRIHAFGGPEVVTYEDVPKPVPREGRPLSWAPSAHTVAGEGAR
jgi:hypothetical protein